MNCLKTTSALLGATALGLAFAAPAPAQTTEATEATACNELTQMVEEAGDNVSPDFADAAEVARMDDGNACLLYIDRVEEAGGITAIAPTEGDATTAEGDQQPGQTETQLDVRVISPDEQAGQQAGQAAQADQAGQTGEAGQPVTAQQESAQGQQAATADQGAAQQDTAQQTTGQAAQGSAEQSATGETTAGQAATEETADEATTEAATTEPATDQAATEDATTEQATSEDATSEQATGEATTEEAATEEAATEGATTEEAATEEASTEAATEPATEPATEEAATEPATGPATGPATEQAATGEAATGEAAAEAEAGAEVAVSDITGREVVTAEGEEIGEIDRVLVVDGEPHAIFKRGGFFGLGSDDVAVPAAQLEMRGEELILTGIGSEEFEAMPEFEAETETALAAEDTVRIGAAE